MNREVRIYVLRDASGAIRYVGYTIRTLQQRLDQHMRRARDGGRTHRENWLRSLSEPPTVELIEIVDEDDADAAERKWIRYYRTIGCDLVNATDGGKGTLGWKQPRDVVEARAAALRGRACSESTKAKISSANSGRRRTPEAKQKMSDAKRGRPWSDARRCAHSDRYPRIIEPILNPQNCATCDRGPFRGARGLYRHNEKVHGIKLTGGYLKRSLHDR